jgi:hypothetical protein
MPDFEPSPLEDELLLREVKAEEQEEARKHQSNLIFGLALVTILLWWIPEALLGIGWVRLPGGGLISLGAEFAPLVLGLSWATYFWRRDRRADAIIVAFFAFVLSPVGDLLHLLR